MADFFSGLKNFAVQKGLMRSDEQEKLDRMIENYEKGGTQGHKDAAMVLKTAIGLSPDLKARTLEVIRDGYLQSYNDSRPMGGMGTASYSPSHKTIQLPPQTGQTMSRLVERVFTLGHETEHARSTKGVEYARQTLRPAIETLARSESSAPRDYTQIAHAYAEWTRADEGRAHIGGFNAIVSFVINDKDYKPGRLLRDLYETHPARMGDFIEKSSDKQPAVYRLKPGLTIGPDGMMPYSAQNIEAMKVHYADKALLGGIAHLNYRQESIEYTAKLVGAIEKLAVSETMESARSYIIDPVRLKAHPALGLPADGLLHVQGIPHLDVLSGDTAVVGPRSAQPLPQTSTQAVQPIPSQGDHPLFSDALTKVVAFDREIGTLGGPQELRNIAAALAVCAYRRGLDSIDNICLSQDTKGLIATQGGNDADQNARVEIQAAAVCPAAQSLAELPAIALAAPASTQETSTVVQSSTPPRQKT